MTSNYFKRRDKDKKVTEPVSSVIVPEGSPEVTPEVTLETQHTEGTIFVSPPVDYNQRAFDVMTPDGGRSYYVVEVDYNPVTLQAVVVSQTPITRLIGLQHANTKMALSMLKKKN